MTRYAYRAYKGERPVILPTDQKPAHYGPSYSSGHSLGDGKKFVRFEPARITVRGQHRVYDVRRLSEDAERLVAQFDKAIADLMRERAEFIAREFLTWQIPDVGECTHVDGQSLDVVRERTGYTGKDPATVRGHSVEYGINPAAKAIGERLRKGGLIR